MAAAGSGPSSIKNSQLTPLALFLQTLIQVRGPLSVHEYMKQCLSHPKYGYYMNHDVFGQKGDFTTAPEISQMFGELIGIWCVATWQQMGSPKNLNIIEFGPGRGTLQADLLSAAKQFPEFYQAINVHMIEISPAMWKLQQQALQSQQQQKSSGTASSESVDEMQQLRFCGDGPSVHWHKDLSTVPTGTPSLFIAQEFFDALPVHQFEYHAAKGGWCERLVDLDLSESEHHFRYVLSNGATPAVRAYLQNKNHTAAVAPENDGEIKEGDRIEFSPLSVAVVTDIARRIVQESAGAALIIDYGHDSMSPDSVRGIRNHQFVHSLDKPGVTDLSVDVDFNALKRFATAVDENVIQAHGPKTQADFLNEMGIGYRLEALLNARDMSEADAETLVDSYHRLIQPDQMGHIFKAMSIAPKSQGTPVGFTIPPASA